MVECFVCGAHTLALSHLFSPWYISPLNFFTHSPLLLLVSPAGTECHLLVSFSPGCPFGGVKKKKTLKCGGMVRWGSFFQFRKLFKGLDECDLRWEPHISVFVCSEAKYHTHRDHCFPLSLCPVNFYSRIIWDVESSSTHTCICTYLHRYVLQFNMTWVQRVYCLAICLISIQPSNR